MATVSHKYMVVYSGQIPNGSVTGRCFVVVENAEGLTTERGIIGAELATLQMLQRDGHPVSQLCFTWFTLLREDGSHVSN